MEEKDPNFLNKEIIELEKEKTASDSLVKSYKYDLINRLPSDMEEITQVTQNKQSKFKRFIENIKKFL